MRSSSSCSRPPAARARDLLRRVGGRVRVRELVRRRARVHRTLASSAADPRCSGAAGTCRTSFSEPGDRHVRARSTARLSKRRWASWIRGRRRRRRRPLDDRARRDGMVARAIRARRGHRRTLRTRCLASLDEGHVGPRRADARSDVGAGGIDRPRLLVRRHHGVAACAPERFANREVARGCTGAKSGFRAVVSRLRPRRPTDAEHVGTGPSRSLSLPPDGSGGYSSPAPDAPGAAAPGSSGCAAKRLASTASGRDAAHAKRWPTTNARTRATAPCASGASASLR